ncbi:hypothetical protein IU470_31110 [Nocardia abscessus]|uniref:Uncharacterized protein n=1 Tax=Nocardia abscessus TaxID=120957 RepID=A0ABS0CHU8_9NOCA|nr:hypothetical protein [Nocardia abscessus]MBF6229526.1 hypothetical protein [Nocardia abscessus]
MSKRATHKVRETGSGSPETARSGPDAEIASPTPATKRAGLSVPVPTVGVRMARVPLPPGPRTVAGGVASATAAVRNRVPDRESLLYFGGLGAAAVTGVVSWPVAGAIGVGVWVAEHARRDSDTAPSGARE